MNKSRHIQTATTRVSILGTYVVRAIGFWSIVNGFLIALAGSDGWANHLYDTLRHVPYSPASWGIVLMVAGALILFGSFMATETLIIRKLYKYTYWIRNLGLIVTGVWCLLYWIGLFTSHFFSVVDPNFTPGLTQLLVGVMCAMLIFGREPRLVPYDREE